MDMTATKIEIKGMTRKVSECLCGKAVACGVEAPLGAAQSRDIFQVDFERVTTTLRIASRLVSER